MAVIIKLTGTVDDLIGYLEDKRSARLDAAKMAGGKDEKARQNGAADGLYDAIVALRQWEPPKPDGQAGTPAFGGYQPGPVRRPVPDTPQA